eukprot:CAMPEP_0195610658 /NCGR_PEP_ID=MMETSP0815-20121206/9927_1 /TAXON_ID=97485 /ORGANISM="Prymnesium parvum, Strain Texoma1" /LENGTH=123 /DNA_ID=CAMNT_0040750663 /DNA_START=356 /DNA_END=727 /DNA_ORIENTATION=-
MSSNHACSLGRFQKIASSVHSDQPKWVGSVLCSRHMEGKKCASAIERDFPVSIGPRTASSTRSRLLRERADRARTLLQRELGRVDRGLKWGNRFAEQCNELCVSLCALCVRCDGVEDALPNGV